MKCIFAQANNVYCLLCILQLVPNFCKHWHEFVQREGFSSLNSESVSLQISNSLFDMLEQLSSIIMQTETAYWVLCFVCQLVGFAEGEAGSLHLFHRQKYYNLQIASQPCIRADDLLIGLLFIEISTPRGYRYSALWNSFQEFIGIYILLCGFMTRILLCRE